MFPKVSMSLLTVFLITPSKDFSHHSLGLTTCDRVCLMPGPSSFILGILEGKTCFCVLILIADSTRLLEHVVIFLRKSNVTFLQVDFCYQNWPLLKYLSTDCPNSPNAGEWNNYMTTTLQLTHCGQICCNLDSREQSLSNNN